MKKSAAVAADGHTWSFFRSGGFDQVKIETAQDLLALETLDQKLWVALACPVDGVHFDTRTLSLIDANGDGRFRAMELLAAIKWTGALLSDPEEMITGTDAITVQSIRDDTPDGTRLQEALRSALSALDKDQSGSVTLAEAMALGETLAAQPFNGDGIITGDAAEQDGLKAAIGDIIKTGVSAADRSGKPGIGKDGLNTFFTQARAFAAWQSEAETDASISALGPATAAAADALSVVRTKIDDYFTRCAVAAFDGRTTDMLSAGMYDAGTFSNGRLSENSEKLKDLPLARVEPHSPLPLDSGLNPAWTRELERFRELTLHPCLGQKNVLSEQDWKTIQTTFAPWYAWQGRKPETGSGMPGISRVRELLDSGAEQEISALIEKDLAAATAFTALADLEKLIRFRRDLFPLSTNFVNFRDFFIKGGPAIFQAGTLYLDQRSCSLCIKVADPAKHSIMAAMAGTYLAYCECRRPGTQDKMFIVAAFTDGDSENLIVGRNGIFYDRHGQDWDATVIRTIENPISLKQAFWLPYKSLVRMIEAQVAKRASAADTRSTAALSETASATANADAGKLAPPPGKMDVGVVAALGVAAGALGTFVATLMGYIAGIIRLGPLAIAGATAGMLLLVSGPSLILAFIKLRKRSLGPILDGVGWAINAKSRITVPFGTLLTGTAVIPPGSRRDLIDPYAEKRSVWSKIVAVLIMLFITFSVLNHFGLVHRWSGGRLGKEKICADVPAVPEKDPTPAAAPAQP